MYARRLQCSTLSRNVPAASATAILLLIWYYARASKAARRWILRIKKRKHCVATVDALATCQKTLGASKVRSHNFKTRTYIFPAASAKQKRISGKAAYEQVFTYYRCTRLSSLLFCFLAFGGRRRGRGLSNCICATSLKNHLIRQSPPRNTKRLALAYRRALRASALPCKSCANSRLVALFDCISTQTHDFEVALKSQIHSYGRFGLKFVGAIQRRFAKFRVCNNRLISERRQCDSTRFVCSYARYCWRRISAQLGGEQQFAASNRRHFSSCLHLHPAIFLMTIVFCPKAKAAAAKNFIISHIFMHTKHAENRERRRRRCAALLLPQKYCVRIRASEFKRRCTSNCTRRRPLVSHRI